MTASPSAITAGIHSAVIPAAGLGTRLRPLTDAIPKELLPIGRRPVLAHILAELQAAGIRRALLVVSERKPQIRAAFGESYSAADLGGGNSVGEPLRCDYVVQKEQRGLGDAIQYAEAWVGTEPFVVALGDCLIESPDPAAPLRRLIATRQEKQAAVALLTEAVSPERVSRYGVLAPAQPLSENPTEPFAVADLIEKPAPEVAPSRMVVAARYVLSPEIFAQLRRTPLDRRGELALADAIQGLCRAGAPVWAVPFLPGEARLDIGSYETFYAAFLRLALQDPEYGEAARRAAQAELTRLSQGGDHRVSEEKAPAAPTTA
jgi:UTP--glucose-1-phosphate uridylyltransferase